MTLQTFKHKKFGARRQLIVEQANEIIEEYLADDLTLTVRQMYYQFVSRGLLESSAQSYKLVQAVLKEGRMAGMIRWDAIEDRTRHLVENSHWGSPAGIIWACARSYAEDKWEDQPVHVEVWIEKEALIGVIERICGQLDVPYFACRGYNSLSEQWSSGNRFRQFQEEGKEVIILHMGDHDPSGIDMTRDNQEQAWTFGGNVEVKRLALNMDQVEEHNPPPFWAKLTDSRANDYIEQYGKQCWELDALDPRIIRDLIEDEVKSHRDPDLWEAACRKEELNRQHLTKLSENWDDIADQLDDM